MKLNEKMKIVVFVVLAFAASVDGAEADQGRRKSLLTGVAVGAVGVAVVGAAGAAVMSRSSTPATVGQPTYTGSTTARRQPVRIASRDDDDESECRTVRTRLYTRDGTYVKTEPLRQCR